MLRVCTPIFKTMNCYLYEWTGINASHLRGFFRVSHRVVFCVNVYVECWMLSPPKAIFLGLSLALRSLVQFKAFHWSTPPNPKPLPPKNIYMIFWGEKNKKNKLTTMYQCYYPHTSRESVSPVLGIFRVKVTLSVSGRHILVSCYGQRLFFLPFWCQLL